MQDSGGFESLWHFTSDDHEVFADRAFAALEVLSDLEGFCNARLLRNVDEPSSYVIATRWRDVGSMRRALGSTRAKLEVWPLLAKVRDQPSAFETLAHADPGRLVAFRSSIADG